MLPLLRWVIVDWKNKDGNSEVGLITGLEKVSWVQRTR